MFATENVLTAYVIVNVYDRCHNQFCPNTIRKLAKGLLAQTDRKNFRCYTFDIMGLPRESAEIIRTLASVYYCSTVRDCSLLIFATLGASFKFAYCLINCRTAFISEFSKLEEHENEQTCSSFVCSMFTLLYSIS